MYLQNIKLWNFRKYGSNEAFDIANPNLNLNFTKGVNVLIGENDSGKTAIIDAIKLVLKSHTYEWIRIDKDDFYRNSEKFRIELLFKDLSIEEAKNFTEWLSWEGEGEDAIPTLKLVYEANIRAERIIPSDVKAGLSEEGYLLTSEAKEYLKVTYLKPLRDAKTELVPKKNSRLSQIFQEHEAFKGRGENHPLKDIFDDFDKSIKNYFNGLDKDEKEIEDLKGKELKKEIDGYLQSFYDATKETDIKVSEGKLKSILEKLELLVKDEVNVGLGTLNRLFMASELLHLNKKDYDGLRLGLIEELEAHLHPQAQMQVIESLQKQENIQLILTTHSPNLASKVFLENLIICNKNYAYPLGKRYTKLKPSDYPFLERFIDITKSNLFFAKGLIFVEGVSEEIILPAIANKLHQLNQIRNNLTSSGVSIISIGNTAFLRYSKIFVRNQTPDINVPISIVTDLDLRPVEYATSYNIILPEKKRKKKIISEFNVSEYKTRMTNLYEEQSVKLFVGDFWTLEYCIALHPTLRKILFKSILQCLEEVRADNYQGNKDSLKGIKPISKLNFERRWQQFIENKSNERIAFDIMKQFIIDGKKISKSMIAMYFSEFFITDVNQIDEIIVENNPIQYLIEAIMYATRN